MDSSSAINTASSIQMDYMKLLITQLQNQNPLEPLDNNEMASQLAQFSELQQLESLNSSFANILSTTQRNYANSLIGKEIAFASEILLSKLSSKVFQKSTKIFISKIRS